MTDPIEVLLKFAFLAVLYLFLLWVARSALRDLRRPAAEDYLHESIAPDQGPVLGSRGRDGGGSAPGSWPRRAAASAGRVVRRRPGLTIGRAPASEVRIDDTYASRTTRASTTATASSTSRT